MQKLAGVLAAVIVGFILDLLGLPISETDKHGIIQWFADGLTLFGTIVMALVYGAFKEWRKRRAFAQGRML